MSGPRVSEPQLWFVSYQWRSRMLPEGRTASPWTDWEPLAEVTPLHPALWLADRRKRDGRSVELHPPGYREEEVQVTFACHISAGTAADLDNECNLLEAEEE